jgi:hypothetical protein
MREFITSVHVGVGCFKNYYCESNDSGMHLLVKMTEITLHSMGNIKRIAMNVPSLRPLVLLVTGVFKMKISMEH